VVEWPGTNLAELMFDCRVLCDAAGQGAAGTAGKQQTPCACVCVALDFCAPPV
jgi:hypothetical protein